MAALELSVGPMFSGKSLRLIQGVSARYYADPGSVGMFQPKANTRDTEINSRVGPAIKAKKIQSLNEILSTTYSTVGVDEFHLFDVADVAAVHELVKRGVSVHMSGLNLDYRGAVFQIFAKLQEVSNVQVTRLDAACSLCRVQRST